MGLYSMPSTRRAVLSAAVAVTAGCASLRSELTSTETQSDSPDEPTETATPQGSGSTPEFVHWQRELPHEKLGHLSLGGGPETPAIFVASAATEDTSNNHALHALSLQRGDEQWRIDLTNPVQNAPMFAGTTESPRLVFSTGRESLHGKEFEIIAVEPNTPKNVWRFDTDERRFVYPIVTTTDSVYVGRADDVLGEEGEFVYALDASNGTERWRTETGDVSQNSNARRRDNLLVSTAGGLDVLNVENGDERWHADADNPAFDNRAKRVFVENDNTVRGLALADGSELWRREFDTDVSGITTPRAAMDETVFVADYDGVVHALSPLDGETRWTLSVADGSFNPQIERTSDRLYVAGPGIHAIDPVSGERAWTFSPDVEISMDVHASTTVFANTNRHLWALDPETGRERWEFATGSRFVGVANAGDLAFVGVDGTAYAMDGSHSP